MHLLTWKVIYSFFQQIFTSKLPCAGPCQNTRDILAKKSAQNLCPCDTHVLVRRSSTALFLNVVSDRAGQGWRLGLEAKQGGKGEGSLRRSLLDTDLKDTRKERTCQAEGKAITKALQWAVFSKWQGGQCRRGHTSTRGKARRTSASHCLPHPQSLCEHSTFIALRKLYVTGAPTHLEVKNLKAVLVRRWNGAITLGFLLKHSKIRFHHDGCITQYQPFNCTLKIGEFYGMWNTFW